MTFPEKTTGKDDTGIHIWEDRRNWGRKKGSEIVVQSDSEDCVATEET